MTTPLNRAPADLDVQLARLRAEHARDRRAIDVLYRVSAAGQGLDSDRAIFDALCRELRAIFPALDSCYIALCDLQNPDRFRSALLYDEGESEHVEDIAFGPFTGKLVRERAPLLIPDLDAVRDTLRQHATTFGQTQKLSRAWMGVPLLLGPDAVGIVSIQSYTPNAFDEADLDLLGRIGQVVVVSLENANLIQQGRALSQALTARVAARTDELAALGAIAAETVLEQPLAALLDRALEQILPLFEARAGNVRLYNRDSDSLALLVQRGIPADDPRAVPDVPVRGSRLGGVVLDNRPLVVESDLARQAFFPGPSLFESMLGIPLRIGARVLGTMVLLDTRPRRFGAQQIDLAQLVGNQLAIAIENARLLEERDRQISELRALGAISQAATTSLNLRMLLREVHGALRGLMPLDAFVMSIYDPRRAVVVEGIGIDEGETYDYFRSNEPLPPESLTAWVVRNRQPLHLRDVAAEIGRFPELATLPAGSGRVAAAWLGVPLFSRDGQVSGTIVVQSYAPNAFSERDEQFLGRVAQQAALHVANVALLAQRDQQIRALDALGRIGQFVSATFDLDQMLHEVYAELGQLMGVSSFFLLVCDAHTGVATHAFFMDGDERVEPRWPDNRPPRGSLSDWIMRQREPLLIGDIRTAGPELARRGITPIVYGSADQPRSWVGVPLLAQDDQAIGVLALQDSEPLRYDDETIDFLGQVARHLSLGVQKVNLFEERERQIRENEQLIAAEQAARRTADTLREVARVLSGTFHADEVLNLILDQLRTVIAYDSASIMLVDGEMLHPVAQRGLGGPGEVRQESFALRGPSGAGLAVSRRQPVVIDDTFASQDWQRHGFGKQIRSWLGVPLLSRGRVLGVLNIDSHLPQHFSERDVEVASAFANHAAVALENAQLYEESVARVEQELAIARRIQSNLFPRELPQIAGIAIAARAVPARETGGDFYDVVPLGGERFGLLMGDASGKSIPAAMLMAVARSTARSEARDHELPETVMQETNRLVALDVPPRSFVALSYGSLDAATRRIALANAGQLSPLRRRADGTVEYLDVPGPAFPLGILPEVAYEAREVQLERGDTLVFYTDGIVEAHNARRELFGFERLEAMVGTLGDLAPHELIDTLLAAVDVWSHGTHQHDDMTLLVLQVE